MLRSAAVASSTGPREARYLDESPFFREAEARFVKGERLDTIKPCAGATFSVFVTESLAHVFWGECRQYRGVYTGVQ